MCMCVTGIILSMGLANERRRYIVTSSLIGCVHTQNNLCVRVDDIMDHCSMIWTPPLVAV